LTNKQTNKEKQRKQRKTNLTKIYIHKTHVSITISTALPDDNNESVNKQTPMVMNESMNKNGKTTHGNEAIHQQKKPTHGDE
jgi:hypothetical protein